MCVCVYWRGEQKSERDIAIVDHCAWVLFAFVRSKVINLHRTRTDFGSHPFRRFCQRTQKADRHLKIKPRMLNVSRWWWIFLMAFAQSVYVIRVRKGSVHVHHTHNRNGGPSIIQYFRSRRSSECCFYVFLCTVSNRSVFLSCFCHFADEAKMYAIYTFWSFCSDYDAHPSPV